MNCPECNGPLGGGVFLCGKCENRSTGEMLWAAIGFNTIPAPREWYWEDRKRQIVAVYSLKTFQLHRKEFQAIQDDSRIDTREQIAKVFFRRLDQRLEEAFARQHKDSQIPF